MKRTYPAGASKEDEAPATDKPEEWVMSKMGDLLMQAGTEAGWKQNQEQSASREDKLSQRKALKGQT